MTTGYVIPLWQPVSLPISGSDRRFPVRRIFCVGRNYREHVREMGGDPEREAPFFFMKPPEAIAQAGSTVVYPPRTAELHHEVEMVAALAEGGADIAPGQALAKVFGYAVGIDLTRRDLQGEAKQARRPWEAGKTFDGAAPCGSVAPAAEIGHPERGAIRVSVNGAIRQDGDLAQMTWKLPEVIAALSGLFVLRPGDLIYTGTPDGVGPVVAGDRLEASVEGLEPLSVVIGPAA